MGIAVDTSLDFEQLATSPAAPAAGTTRLYAKTAGGLWIRDSIDERRVIDGDTRAPATWFSGETGTPLAPSNAGSPLNGNYIAGQMGLGDSLVRKSDGEVFTLTGASLAAATWVDQLFTLGTANPNVNATLAGRATYTGSSQITIIGAQIVPLNNADFGSANFDLVTNHCYTVAVAGIYDIEGSVSMANAVGPPPASIYVNGVERLRGDRVAIPPNRGSTGFSDGVAGKLQLAAGDKITLWTAIASGGGPDWDPGNSYLAVSMVAPVTAAGVMPNTAAKVYLGNPYTVPQGPAGLPVWTKVPLDTVAANEDPGTHIDTANHRYLVRQTGWYHVEAALVSTSSIGNIPISVYQNGVQAGSATGCTLYCQAGDVLELWAQESSSATAATVGTGVMSTYLTVFQVDQAGGGGGSGGGPTGPTVWFTAETGTPLAPSNGSSPLNYAYLEGEMVLTDTLIRKSDGEVFALTGASIAAATWVDQGFSLGITGPNIGSQAIARAYHTGFVSLTATAYTKVPVNAVSFDPGGNFDVATNHRYVCPVAGYYHVSAAILFTTTTPGVIVGSAIFKNGTQSDIGAFVEVPANQTSDVDTPVSDVIQCAAGDYLELYGWSQAAGSTTFPGASYTYMAVELIAPITSAPVTPNTAARASRSAALTLAAGAWTKVPLDTVASFNDPGGHMDVTTNHRYNVTQSGWYQVNGQVIAAATATNQRISASIYKTGAQSAQGSTSWSNGAEFLSASVSDLILCAPGDYIELDAYSDNALGMYVGGGAAENYLSVVKVDQPSPGLIKPVYLPLPYGSNWVDYGAGQTPGGYCVDQMGFCHVKGLAKSLATFTYGSATGTPFTLPVGARPPTPLLFMLLYDDGVSGALSVLRADLLTSGALVLNNQVGSAAVGDANSWLSFDSFPVFQVA